ncbi:hypothetical protein HKBW3S06_00925 [Candidatus Hakubella thermalkaliphila]|uniref:DUF111 family protein n=1 Tax=Candidatus Hakubella thermalkaliphila TaxID=2754717 RepID=A0A6V8NN14_9ACTN|nr:nickel insertion protein [Candidatus Hakubella thermalkaliphila]GFP21698.1 hypothetical protein HKBW3S06_00925 [Candidatus Hakubella thermalkaliphila]
MLVQTDDLSGEMAGYAIQQLLDLGVDNVQIVPTVTKKNRPAYLVLIDCEKELLQVVENFLISELYIGGYHLLQAHHVSFDTHLVERTVDLQSEKGKVSAAVAVRVFGSLDQPRGVKVDHDSLGYLCRRIKAELGVELSLKKLQTLVEANVLANLCDKVIKIRL